MKHVLEPLARTPGVRLAALVTPDGVPITVHGSKRRENDGAKDSLLEKSAADDADALAALATGWIGEIQRAIAPLSWDEPRHLVLRAARGTLVVMPAPGALLVVVLESGMRAEELRLSMEGAVARIHRHLKSFASKSSADGDPHDPPSALPSRPAMQARAPVPAGKSIDASVSGNESPEVSRE